MTSTSSISSSASSTSYYTTGSTGLDTAALVEVAVAAKLAPADSLQTKIDDNETKISAYQELQTLLQTLEDSVDSLRNPYSSSSNSDVFAARTTYVTGGGSLTTSDYFDITVDDDVTAGTHTLEIQQIATAQKVAATTAQTSSSDALGYTGSFTIGLDGGTQSTIDVTSDMTLTDIQDAINNATSTSNVSASIVSTTSGSYTLVLSASETGLAITTSSTSGTDIMQSLSITDSNGDYTNELSTAQSAIIVLDGLTVTRTSNTIDDAIDGLTLHLYDDAAGTTFDVEVAQDLSAIKEAVQTFIDAYNAFRDFIVTQQSTSTSGGAADDAVLFGDSTVKSVSKAISSLLSEDWNGYSLSDLGITLNDDNTLALDEDTLDTLLLDDPEAVETLFSTSMTSSSSNLTMLRRGTDLGSTDFTLDVTVDASGAITSASIGGDSSMFTVSGSRIVGATGTAYEGYTFVWTGKTEGTTSVSVSISQGIGDLIYQTADDYGNTTDGQIQDLVDTLQDADDKMTDRISQIEENAARYQTFLEARYAAMEVAAQTAKILLAQMEAMSNANSNN